MATIIQHPAARKPRLAPEVAKRSGSVDLTEALESRLPYHTNNPFEVAVWLNAGLQRNAIQLLANEGAIPPASFPTMVSIVAFDNPPRLHVVLRAWAPEWTEIHLRTP
jgi:hypothetical protein